MKNVYLEASSLAERDEKFVLATVVNTSGSTPQKPGACLLVRSDGSTVGTLGGGCVEGDIWFAAKEALRHNSEPIYKDYFLNEEIAAQDGLVCGGSMYFYIEPVLDPSSYTDLTKAISNAYDGIGAVAVATVVNSNNGNIGKRIAVLPSGKAEGTLGNKALDEEAIKTAISCMPMGKTQRFETSSGDEIFVVAYTSPPSILLIGGGHVNVATAQIAESVGFRVFVADDRKEFANKDRFPMAEKVFVGPYKDSIKQFDITPNTAIVVASRGHQFDDVALEKAAETDAGYVGLIGSKRKALLIYESMLKNGISIDRIKSIHAPVGLDLGGRDPSEIAISIVSEILAWRHGKTGKSLKIDDGLIERLVSKNSLSEEIQ